MHERQNQEGMALSRALRPLALFAWMLNQVRGAMRKAWISRVSCHITAVRAYLLTGLNIQVDTSECEARGCFWGRI